MFGNWDGSRYLEAEWGSKDLPDIQISVSPSCGGSYLEDMYVHVCMCS